LAQKYGPRRPLVTTDRVCEETWTLLRRKRGHATALAFATFIRSPHTAVRTQRVDAELAKVAWEWLRARDEREYSFVDASSFAVMRAFGLTEAFAFDGDFNAAGFVELRP
jgi:predicted nucleic acid-binding protein